MKTYNGRFLLKAGIGVVLVLIGLGLRFAGFDRLYSITLINAGLIAIIFSLFYHFRYKGKVYQDERTIKIGMKSLAYSWMGTFVLVGVLAWLESLSVIKLTAQQTISIIMVFMALTGSVLQLVFGRKGDVE